MRRRRRQGLSFSFQKALKYEIEEARSIQQAMTPAEPLRDHPIEVECKFRPVAEVGGDFLDYYWMSDHKLGFFVGDVVGKGLPAALYAALAVGILRGINKGSGSPTGVLEFLNRRLLDRAVPNRYCAVQYGVFDPSSLVLSVANAGLRPRPLHVSAKGCREMGDGGLPCGLFKDVRYPLSTLRLSPGDVVLFSTDGLIEAQNPRGHEFGIERLKKVCAKNNGATPSVLLERVFAAVDKFAAGAPQHDDMTAVALHIA